MVGLDELMYMYMRMVIMGGFGDELSASMQNHLSSE